MDDALWVPPASTGSGRKVKTPWPCLLAHPHHPAGQERAPQRRILRPAQPASGSKAGQERPAPSISNLLTQLETADQLGSK